MQTQCPACNTEFVVKEIELTQADGLVRCGRCGYIFNAEAGMHLSSAPAAKRYSPEVLKQILLGKNVDPPESALIWMLGIVTITLILGLQVLYLSRNKLAQHPQLGIRITNICTRIPFCTIQPKRNLSQIKLISRNVYSHPTVDGALMVNAVIKNTAAFAQPFPLLLVSMSNVRGQVVAERYFQPVEYLTQTDNKLMGKGTPVSISLEIMDPGQNAIAFELDFF